MAKKYYAVKNGYVPGIYETWDECKKQVTGFSGAAYKSFPTYEDAKVFLGLSAETHGNKTSTSENNRERIADIVAYVDGSYDDDNKTFSYGVVLLYDGKEAHFSKRMNTRELLEMRNVAGEIKAAEFAMQYCVQNGIKSLDLYHDYEGIAKWCTGEWKANKVGTKAYKEFYDTLKNDVDVRFIKVKGHSGDKYNDIADELAKAAVMDREGTVENMGKTVNVYLDRNTIDLLIQDVGQKEWGEDFSSQPLAQIGQQQRCKFSVSGVEAMLDFYFKADGSATIRSTGTNMEYADRLKELIIENSFKNEHQNANCKFSNVKAETFQSLIDYLGSLEKLSILEDKTVESPAHRHLKYKSTFGDSLVINMYDSGTLLFQGNPAYILTEAMYFMTLRPEVSEEDVSAQRKVIYKSESISVSEARQRLKARIPNAYDKLDEITLKILSPSISLSNSRLEAEEYSCYVFPALRALESVLLDLLLKKKILVNPPKQNLGTVFVTDSETKKHVLTTANKKLVSNEKYEKQLEKMYNYLKKERHVRFHANQVLMLTTLIFNKEEADAILNDVLDIIEETAKEIM